jgi:glycine/D-amino acid oxidase-like deaminating enzyme
MSDTYDVTVLGAGSTGTSVAWYAGDNGLSVAVVERELVGASAPTGRACPARRLLRHRDRPRLRPSRRVQEQHRQQQHAAQRETAEKASPLCAWRR